MTPDRWTLALETGVLTLPEAGKALVLRAAAEADFSALGDVTAVQGFFPGHRRLEARGVDVCVAPEGVFDVALVQSVKARAESLSLVAQALTHLRPGGLLLVDGQKSEGIESYLKAVRAVLPVEDVLSKSHGKLFWLTRPETLPPSVVAWKASPQRVEGGYITAPGGFSADGPDPGSELLVALVPLLKGRIADLGAGWGYIAAELLAEQDGITRIDLVEAEWAALEAAKANIDDPRAQYIWGDATSHHPDEPYDVILSNPPFHIGRDADPGLGRAFIASAARMLKRPGQFFMVANRHLPYEAALKDHFGTGRMLAELQGYKLYQASKPKQAKP
ncbi:class I SAM-dependent methyltransferase [Rhodophyticola sp. CCM32]|uniref:class I SAM-dependent methyltransferase n=1 Tax=Rhodophyticola sp. CCM32 TaxID=2916397 RepID=UPI00107FA64B|nr:class I SAM-dependent methyltransferase [Rhodophyticola sp. CCM32]QBY02261.1 class I SAM-dependent methyltransferase [Rhodophyticola sp. CCM32]